MGSKQTGVMPNLGRQAELWARGLKHPPSDNFTGTDSDGEVWRNGQRKWLLPRDEMMRWAEMWDWMKPRMPDPFRHLEKIIDKMTVDQAREEIKLAQERELAMMTIDSPEAMILLDSVEGRVHKFFVLLRMNHPDITEEECYHILEQIGRDKEREALAQASGEPPPVGNAEAPAA